MLRNTCSEHSETMSRLTAQKPALDRPRALLRRALGREGLDYESPAGQRALENEEAPGPVDVIVPVHGGGEIVERCFESLLEHTDLERHCLVVVIDGDPDFAASATRERLDSEGEERVEILEHDTAQGFVASVNRGMGRSQNDVVLVNSDVVVTAGWLEKLQAAAYSAPEIATATPFSNDATLCSLPRPFVANALPRGLGVDAFAARVESASERAYSRLPTGVGLCLYVKRRALDELGLFDRERFGKGYGEEVDFCFRALEAGWAHVHDDATFVYHEGQASFGPGRERRVRAAERRLRRLHPGYTATLAHFMARDPLRPARERVLRTLVPPLAAPPRPPRRVAHMVHGWPPWARGGTEFYAAWLAARQAEIRDVSVYARLADPGRAEGEVLEALDGRVRVRLAVNNFSHRHPLVRNGLSNPRLEADFGAFLDEVDPELIHVHHLAGHAASLMAVAARRRVPIVYQMQDWWPLCARVNLWRPEGELCSGPSSTKCAACRPLTGLPPSGIWNPLLHRLRRLRMERALGFADAFVCGSRYIAESYREEGFLKAGARLHVLPYGVEPPAQKLESPALEKPLRFGLVGALMPHKGVHVAVEAFAGVDRSRARLEIWGNPEADPVYARELETRAGAAVSFRGPFPEGTLDRVFSELHALLMPSLGLESYGLAAREALVRGVPVVVSRRGALPEIFAEVPGSPGSGGTVFEAGDAAALAEIVEGLIDEPEILTKWMAGRPAEIDCDRHAEAIEEVYAELLGRGGR